MTESGPTEQTNALLAAVVASSMDAVFSIDTSARIQTWNSAAEQLYGYTAAEAIGQPLGLLAPDPTNYAPGTRFQRVLQGEQIYFETSRRRKDGSLVEVGISSGPIRDSSGHVVGVSVVHRDISERKRSERDLRQMHQWLEMAQEAGDVAPWAYDPKTGEVRWTKQLYRQLGYGSDEITPSLSAFRERAHPDDQMGLDDRLPRAPRQEGALRVSVALGRDVSRGGRDSVAYSPQARGVHALVFGHSHAASRALLDDVDLDLGHAFAGDAQRFGGGRRDVKAGSRRRKAILLRRRRP
jgi:PAS domain S-box-containing protein